MNRENAIELQTNVGEDLDDVINKLIAAKERGESVYSVFNGHKLYSCDVTMDSGYLEVVGRTKEEHDMAINAWREEYNKKLEEESKMVEEGHIEQANEEEMPKSL